MIIKKVSHSRMNIFKHCPYQYRLQYHEKVKSPLPEPDYFEFGTCVHAIFESIVEEDMELKEAYEKHIGQYKISAEHKRKFPIILRNFISFQKRISEIAIKQKAEEEFKIDVNGILFNGLIDRTIYLNDNKVLIVDYKTGKQKNELTQAKAQVDGQLLTYVWATAKTDNIPVENIVGMFFYVLSGRKVMVKFTEKQVLQYIDSTAQLAMKIKEMEPIQAKPNVTRLCNWCKFRTVCTPYLRYQKITSKS